MKPSLFLFSLVGTVLAGRSTQKKRDVTTIENALNAINTAAGTLDTDVKAFDGSSAAVTTLESDSAAVLNAINTGNSQIAPTAAISDTDALTVAGTTQTLITTLNQTISDLIAQKPAFDSAGVSSTVLSQLQQQNSAATTFGATVVSKVPCNRSSLYIHGSFNISPHLCIPELYQRKLSSTSHIDTGNQFIISSDKRADFRESYDSIIDASSDVDPK
ncbi:MAG: hypothetical protein M1822_006349 [Bathelium mastoideum]|nr:MAG: hypothetical protein M1822_006349 [Bathelium mastoideum]